MTAHTLSVRGLNRATLARQMLLARATLPAPQAIDRLAGLQAQLPVAPYIGLWTRLHDFRREDLARPIEERCVVKATLMRATLHLFSAEDYLQLRATLQPALDQAAGSIARRRAPGLDYERAVEAARAYIAEELRTFAEISAMLSALMRDADVGPLRYTVRTRLPLVQAPVANGWSYPGNPRFALADRWLGRPVPVEQDLRALVWRYLAAFGPATVSDLQTWSGLAKLKEPLQALKPELVTFRDVGGRELLDLPDAPRPGADAPAPARFLPDFDNLLLGHSLRTRIIPAAFHAQVFLPGLRVAATVLVDGFVAGAWKIETARRRASLVIEPFVPFDAPTRAALAEEGERLVRFVAGGEGKGGERSFEVRFEGQR